MKLLKSGFEHVAQTQLDASEALRGEFAYQIDRLNKQLAQQTTEIVAAEEQSRAEIVGAIQLMSDYLGAGLSEVRWAVERHTRVSEEHLRVLLDSLSNESRQYFVQGVKCYDVKEDAIAKECFTDALTKNKTNFFAYQYLGFIAVHADNENEAIRNFDLARKFAEIDENKYHHALALSHLARSHHATEELEKAARFANKATQTYPQLAKFWYELAGYSARLQRTNESINGLREAIERDWTFFTVVVGDNDFEPIRAQVNTLLDSLRERERLKARQSLDNLRKAINTAQKCGAGNEIALWTKSLNNLETNYQQGNVFLYREAMPKANELHDKVFQAAEQTLSKRVEEKQRELKTSESDRNNQIYALCSNLNNLNSEGHRFDSTGGEKIDVTLYIIGFVILFIALFFGSCFVLMAVNKPAGDEWKVEVSNAFWIAVIAPILLIGGGKFLNYLFTKGIPGWSLKQKKNREAARVQPLKLKLEQQFDRTHRVLKKELEELESLFNKCKSKQYV